MSLDETHRRKCIQKLDFENCIITNIKTTARGRKKLRARITREIEQVSDILEKRQHCEKPSVPTPQTSSQLPEPSSPVLIRKQNKKFGSFVFSKKKKINFPEEDIEKSCENSAMEEMPSPGSPVFKTFKKHKTEDTLLSPCQDFHNVFERMTGLDMFNSQENSGFGLQSSFQIDEFTQESKPSIKISSVESKSVKSEGSSSISVESKTTPLKTCHQYSPLEMSHCYKALEKHESPKPVRKNYNKNSLLVKLHKLQQKQASEKLLWQHQNRKNSTVSLKVSVVSFWKEEFSYFLRCQSLHFDIEQIFIIVDSRWVPNVKKITEGSVIQLHPPWQKLSVKESVMTILLNVICLDVLNETKEPILPKKTFESVPVNQFETDPKLFVDSLFSCCDSGFL